MVYLFMLLVYYCLGPETPTLGQNFLYILSTSNTIFFLLKVEIAKGCYLFITVSVHKQPRLVNNFYSKKDFLNSNLKRRQERQFARIAVC